MDSVGEGEGGKIWMLGLLLKWPSYGLIQQAYNYIQSSISIHGGLAPGITGIPKSMDAHLIY